MKHKSMTDLGAQARVVPAGVDPARVVRRARLERFAALLEDRTDRLRLLSRIEYNPMSSVKLMRLDESPAAVAYADPVFRGQGLAGDRLGDMMSFFSLSWNETHHLLCDCHYGTSAVDSRAVAERVRAVARRQSLAEIWSKVRRGFAAIWRG
jgi:hypothetical protein